MARRRLSTSSSCSKVKKKRARLTWARSSTCTKRSCNRRPGSFAPARCINREEKRRSLHSGNYGSWAPNPEMLLAHLLASMKDETGRVKIAGWYEGVEPLGDEERRAISDAPAYDDQIRVELGLAKTEGNGKLLMEMINQPSDRKS